MTTFRTVCPPTRTALLSILILMAFVLGACRQVDVAEALRSDESSGAPAVTAVDEASAIAEAGAQAEAQAEAEAAAARAEVEAAERALAEREALVAEREQQLREAQALQEERLRLAARSAAIEERERGLEARTQELEARESAVEAREFDVYVREETLADQDVPLPATDEAGGWIGDEEESDEWVEPTAPAAPAPARVEASLLPGKVLEVEMLETLTSRNSRVGDTFSARLVQDLRNEDGILVIPAGAEILGEVTHVTPLKKIGGRAEIGIEFTHVVVSPDQTVEIRATLIEVGADKRKDKKKILIGTAAGAILGSILGGDTEGAVAGAAVGAAAGTAVAASAKGKDAEIPAGEKIALQLEEVVTVSVQMTGPVEP